MAEHEGIQASKMEVGDNKAVDGSVQLDLRDVNGNINLPKNTAGIDSREGVKEQLSTPRQWYQLSRKGKAIFALSIISIVTLCIVLPVYFKVHSDKGTSRSTSETTTAPLAASPTSPIASSLSTSATSTSTSPLPPPPSPSADGVRLVNTVNGTAKGSGFAYYASAVDGNNGAKPNDYTVATSKVFAHWEGQQMIGFFSDTNTTFEVQINTTDAPVNAKVAQASNGFRTFDVYKDDGRLLFTENGTEFYTIYFCQ